MRSLVVDGPGVATEIADEHLSSMRWAVVLGSAGAGKSAIVREQFLRAARAFLETGEGAYPVFVDLEGVGQGPLIDVVDGPYRGAVEAARSEGVPVALYVDGVDEGARLRPDLRGALSRLIGHLRPARTVVACRTVRWSDEWTDAIAPDEWEPSGPAPVYTADYLEPSAYDELLVDRAIRQAFFDACASAGVHDLLRTPFDGFWLARRYAESGELPTSRRASLSEQVRERLGRRADGGPALSRLEELAGHLAVVSSFGSGPVWTAGEVVDLLGASEVARREINATAEEAKALLGTALFKAVGEGTYAFAHQLYREHLASDVLAQAAAATRRSLLTVAEGGRGRVVPEHRALAAMLAERVPEWWDVLVDLEPRVLLLAESRGDRSAGAGPLVSAVIEGAVEAGDPAWAELRPTGEKLWWLLARHRPRNPVPVVAALLQASDPLRRQWGAACALAWEGVPGADGLLVRVALDDGDRTDTRQYAIAAVVKGGQARSLRALRPLLRNADDLVRGEAIRAYVAEGADALAVLRAFDGGPRGEVYGSLQRAAREFGLGLGVGDVRAVIGEFARDPARFGKLRFWLLDGLVARGRELGEEGVPSEIVNHVAGGHFFRGDLDRDLAAWMRARPEFWARVFRWAVDEMRDGRSPAYRLPDLLTKGWTDGHAAEVRAAWDPDDWTLRAFLRRIASGVWSADRRPERLADLRGLLGPVVDGLEVPTPPQSADPTFDVDARFEEAVGVGASRPVARIQSLLEAAVAVRDAARLEKGDPYVTEDDWLRRGASVLSPAGVAEILSRARATTQDRVYSALADAVASSTFSRQWMGGSSWRLTDERVERALFTLIDAGRVPPGWVLAAAAASHAFGHSAANLDYGPVLSALRQGDGLAWEETLRGLYEDPQVDTGQVLRYLRDLGSPVVAPEVVGGLRLGAGDVADLDECVAYVAAVRPEGWREALLAAYRHLDTRGDGLSGPWRWVVLWPLLPLLAEDNDQAWDAVAWRADAGDLPTTEDRQPRAIRLVLPPSAARAGVLLTWFASVRAVQRDDDHEAHALSQLLLSHVVAVGDAQGLAELRRLQRGGTFEGARWLSHSVGEMEDRLLEDRTERLEAGVLLDLVTVPSRRLVRDGRDLTDAVLGALDEIQADLRRGEGVPSYWNEPGAAGGGYEPKSEEGCQNALWLRVRDKLRGYRVMAAEAERFVGPNRVDFAVDAETVGGGTARMVVEAKVARSGYAAAKLVRPVRAQLVERYMKRLGLVDGVYLVFWFKGSKGVDYPKRWATPEALGRSLQAEADRALAEDGVRVVPVVIDVSAPWRER